MVYRIVQVSGRREIIYHIEAESKEQALERYGKYLGFLGVAITKPIEAEEEKHD